MPRSAGVIKSASLLALNPDWRGGLEHCEKESTTVDGYPLTVRVPEAPDETARRCCERRPPRFFAGVMAVIENGKITHIDEKKTIKIVADAGGGYLRVEDLTVSQKPPHYLGINGEEQSNFVNERGKQQGRSKEDFRKATHFRIKKREEMNEQ